MADVSEKALATLTGIEEKVVAAVTDYDVYEIRARVVVGFIIALPTAIGFTYLMEGRVTPQFIWSAAVVEAVLAMLLAQTVRAFGHWRGATKGWDAGWTIVRDSLAAGPGAPYNFEPTQVAQWQEAVKAQTGLDLAAEPEFKKRRRLAQHAYTRLLYQFRDRTDVSPFLMKFTVDYGFARNLAGSWPLWMVTSLIFAVVLFFYSSAHPGAAMGATVELACFLFGLAVFNPLDQQVADARFHLAEIFLCVLVDCKPTPAEPKTEPVPVT